MNYEVILRPKFEGSLERVGFLLADGTVVECRNIAVDPAQGFEVDPAETIQWCDQAIATWHTHPGASSNLSMDDYHCFLSWPQLKHVILGEGDISVYYVQDGELLSET